MTDKENKFYDIVFSINLCSLVWIFRLLRLRTTGFWWILIVYYVGMSTINTILHFHLLGFVTVFHCVHMHQSQQK